MLQINIKNFIELIQKVTIKFAMNYVQLVVTKDKVKCSITNTNKNLISRINIDNDFIIGLREEELNINFIDANINLIPFLNLFEEEVVDLSYKMFENNIVKEFQLKDDERKKNIKLNFCIPIAQQIFHNVSMKDNLQFFDILQLDDIFYNSLKDIKKIAYQTNKIYFSVENNKLLIETGDKKSNFINSLKIELHELKNENLNLCFDAKNFISLMGILDTSFICKLIYKKEKKLGMLYIFDEDCTREYYLTSLLES